jgi:hypothetical protein
MFEPRTNFSAAVRAEVHIRPCGVATANTGPDSSPAATIGLSKGDLASGQDASCLRSSPLQRLISFRGLVSVFALPPVGVKVTFAVAFALPVSLSL